MVQPNLNLLKYGISRKSFIAQCIKYLSNFTQTKFDLSRNFIQWESWLVHPGNPLQSPTTNTKSLFLCSRHSVLYVLNEPDLNKLWDARIYALYQNWSTNQISIISVVSGITNFMCKQIRHNRILGVYA